jgi:predicted HTH domain antitoxin
MLVTVAPGPAQSLAPPLKSSCWNMRLPTWTWRGSTRATTRVLDLDIEVTLRGVAGGGAVIRVVGFDVGRERRRNLLANLLVQNFVTIQLLDDMSAALEEQWQDMPRRSLEAIAVEAYRTGALTDSQVRRMLGSESRFQLHALLKEHHVSLHYTAADFEHDLQAQRELGTLRSR